MTRLKKELKKRNLVFSDCDSENCYSVTQSILSIGNQFIILVRHCDVLDPILIIVDKNYNVIAEQLVYKADHIQFPNDTSYNTWDVYFYEERGDEEWLK